MLLQLLPELHDQVIGHCDVATLKNLARTNSTYNQALKKLLWYAVNIPCSHLAKKDFEDAKKLINLKYTRILRFENDYDYEDYETVGKKTKKKIRAHYKVVLEHCDPNLVHTFFVNNNSFMGGQCIPLACQTFKKMEKVSIVYGWELGDGYREISNLQHLVELNLDHCDTYDDDLPILLCKKFNKLKVLNLGNTHIGPENGLVHIDKLPALEELILTGCEIYDKSLPYISKLPLLKKIHLRRCIKITDVGFKHICDIPYLEELSIRYARISDIAMSSLSTVVTLRRLDISKCFMGKETGITNTGLAHISNLVLLRELNLSHCYNITNDGLVHVASLTSLESLKINFITISNAGVYHLRDLITLKELGMCGTVITDLALSYVCCLPLLEVLDVCRTNVTYLGVAYLASVRSLKTLKYSDKDTE